MRMVKTRKLETTDPQQIGRRPPLKVEPGRTFPAIALAKSSVFVAQKLAEIGGRLGPATGPKGIGARLGDAPILASHVGLRVELSFLC